MFCNILWDADILHSPCERNIINAEVVREFLPEVAGFQECGKAMREGAFNYSINKTMCNYGYVEADIGYIENSYHNINCTPLKKVRFTGALTIYFSQINPQTSKSEFTMW